MTKRALAALSTAVALSGCMSVNVSEDAFFYPDSRLKAENIVLPAGRPTAQAAETMTLSYAGGVVGATRVRTGRADAPLILFCGGNMFRRSNGAGSVAEKLSPLGDVLMFDYPGYGTPREPPTTPASMQQARWWRRRRAPRRMRRAAA